MNQPLAILPLLYYCETCGERGDYHVVARCMSCASLACSDCRHARDCCYRIEIEDDKGVAPMCSCNHSSLLTAQLSAAQGRARQLAHERDDLRLRLELAETQLGKLRAEVGALRRPLGDADLDYLRGLFARMGMGAGAA